MWELRIRCSNWGWMCKKQNMLKNWTGEGGGSGICDAFLMHLGIFRNKLFRIIFWMVFLMHFGFLLTGLKKKIKHLLTGGVLLRSLGILEVILDYGAHIRR